MGHLHAFNIHIYIYININININIYIYIYTYVYVYTYQAVQDFVHKVWVCLKTMQILSITRIYKNQRESPVIDTGGSLRTKTYRITLAHVPLNLFVDGGTLQVILEG